MNASETQRKRATPHLSMNGAIHFATILDRSGVRLPSVWLARFAS